MSTRTIADPATGASPPPSATPHTPPAAFVGQHYWDATYNELGLKYNPDLAQFKSLFARYMPKGGTCFEIGAYPGHFLVYLSREFGYEVSGLDLTPGVRKLDAHMRANGAKPGKFVEGDFFTYTDERQYDVVCSFGFIEHFENFQDVIRRHLPLLKPGGTLVISCPNFRRIQYLLRVWLDRENLGRHNLRAMDLAEWERVLRAEGMEIHHGGFDRTFEFWSDSPLGRIRGRVCRLLASLGSALSRGVDAPNRFTSPYMVLFAKKPVA